MTIYEGVFKWECIPKGTRIVNCGRNICLIIPKEFIKNTHHTIDDSFKIKEVIEDESNQDSGRDGQTL